MKNTKHMLKFSARTLAEVGHNTYAPLHKKSAAQRREAAKKTVMVTPRGNVVVAASYAAETLKKEWTKK